MLKRMSISTAIVFAVTSEAALAGALSDNEISQKILGSWVVPTTSTDYVPNSNYVVETFRPDGTYIATVYQSADCKVRLQQAQVLWSVQSGVLISTFPNGGGSKDQVESIDAKIMTLHSLDDGSTYTRAKSEVCGKSVS